VPELARAASSSLLPYRQIVDANHSRPCSDGFGSTECLDSAIVAPVVLLRPLSFPPHISGSVMVVIIDPAERHSGRAVSQFCVKLLEAGEEELDAAHVIGITSAPL
jgi:hypothetical protein